MKNRHHFSLLAPDEIRKGIEMLLRNTPDQCPALETWRVRLQSDCDQDILPLSGDIAERWARISATVAQTLAVIDGLIAATAQEIGLTVMTSNAANLDRAGVGARMANPFASTVAVEFSYPAPTPRLRITPTKSHCPAAIL